jgi:IPT/TIG domain-containing protein/carboxypeptidase family protein/PKD domain-containing protein
MKRALHFVLLTLVLLSAIEASAAAKKQSKHPKVRVYKAQPGAAIATSPRPKPARKRMGIKSLSEGELVAAPGPVSAGPPTEGSMQRAASPQLDLRFLPQTPPIRQERPEREAPIVHPVTVEGTVVPPNRNIAAPAPQNAPAPSPSANFLGLDFANWGGVHPPDTVGDVGPNHYIQAVNTSIGIYSKSGGAPLAAFAFNTFMSQGHFGNLCDTNNFGDPVILYDTFEDRWVITDFAFVLSGGNILNPPGAFQCFAVSKTGDPISGGWNFYSLHLTDFVHDYPKLGIWPDGIYMSANMFGFPATGTFEGTRVWALNKSQMYAGAPSIQVVQFNPPADEFTLLPSNARLQAGTPPADSPNYFSAVWNFTNAVSTYKFHVDWNRISLSTFDGPFVTIAPASWAAAPDFVPAKNGNNNDTLATRLMMQNQYTNLGGVESLWQTHTVQNPTVPGVAAVRYYQTNITGGAIAANTAQASTHAPDTTNRYMPSLAVDRAGNMALGYSASTSTLYPAIRYAGRLAADPVNSLPQTETSLIEGTGSQNSSNRWGDYSAMSLDPDGCTFWYTNEYYATIGGNWQTRIGSFNYGPSACMPVATGTVSGTVTATAGGAPIGGAAVSFGSRTTATDGNGMYSFLLVSSGMYPGIAVTAPGYNSGTATTIAVADGSTTTQNFSLSAAPTSGCLADTNQADFQTGVPTNTDLASTPDAVILYNTPVLDQQNTSLSSQGNGIDTTTWGGQTFTAALTGPLARADVAIFCSGCTGTFPNLTLSLRATSGNLPTGPDLATTTLPGNNSGASGYLTGTFANPATVTAGTTYALIVRPVANPSAGSYALTYSSSNAYANGQIVSSTDGGGTWTGAGADLGFRTYVKTAFTTSGDFVSALKDANPAAGATPIWSTISWTATVPASTSLKFQVAASNSASGPFAFVGPDGTAATFFMASGASLSQFYGFRYLKYKAFMATADTTQTPVLNDVTICYSVADCSAPIAITTPSQACANSTGNTASGTAGAASYAWSVVNGTIIGSTASQSVTYTAGASGSVGLTLNVVDAAGCHKQASANVTIVATPTPAVTPSGATTFCTGGSVTLTSSSATGNQWYNGATLLAGQTNQTYVAATTGNYNVVVTANGCSSAPSASTAVTVNAIPPTPTVMPSGATTFCAGNSVTLTSSSATGNQWYNGATLLAGQSSQNFVATTTGNYNVIVTMSGCSSAPSSSTAVTVTPLPPTPTITPGGATTFCTGGSVTLTSSSATGNQWYNGATLLAGQTSQTYVAATTGNYNVVVTASGCSSAASASTAVTVNAIPPTPTVTPGGATTFCAGNSVTLTSSSATGNQWYNGAALLAGQTSQSFIASTSGNYNVIVTTSGCSSAASSSTAVTVNPLPPTPTITPGGATTFCAGGSVTLTSSSASGNQWFVNGNAIGAATATTYNAAASGNYTVKVTDGNSCTSAASPIIAVTVNTIPATPTITPGGSAQFCSAGSKTLTSSSAIGNQWYLEGVLLSGATNQTVSADNAGHYTVVVTSGCSSASSAATNVTINPTPAKPVITPGGPATFCAGGSVTLSSNSAAGNQWYVNGNPITGGTNQSFVAAASGSYTAVVTSLGCASNASDPIVVTVNPLPATPAITPGGPTTFCAGGSVALTSNSAAGNQWFLNGNAIGGATNQAYSATSSGSYTVKVTGANSCTSTASAATVVTVNPIPATPTITPGGSTTFCAGGSVNLTSSSASGNQWFLNGNAIGGATNQLYSAAASGSYTVTVTTSGCSSAASTATVVTVNPKPNAAITAPINIITNSTGNIASVANAGAGATYAWSITGGAITAGSGTNSITFTAGGPGTLTLNVTVTTSAGCSDAKSANVTVSLPPVTLTSVSPGLGTTAGGSPITINGSGFVNGAAVNVGGAAATNVVVVSAIKITAKTPPHASGTVNVSVTNTDTSTAAMTSGFRYQAIVFDPNADNVIDPADIFFMINYLFTGGQAPHGEAGLLSGDANNDFVIDPADIFFIINYLFLGGQKPSAVPNAPHAMAAGTEVPKIAGSISLGNPVVRGGHYFVPVIMTAAPGSIVPQTMSLKVRFDSEGTVGEAAVRRAGVAKDLNAVFEFGRRTGNDLSYLVSYDPRGLALGASRSAVVAEIEIDSIDTAVSIGIDPLLTMLGDQSGTTMASVANGKLRVSGTTIGNAKLPRPRSPRPEFN